MANFKPRPAPVSSMPPVELVDENDNQSASEKIEFDPEQHEIPPSLHHIHDKKVTEMENEPVHSREMLQPSEAAFYLPLDSGDGPYSGMRGYDDTYWQDQERDYNFAMFPPSQDVGTVDGKTRDQEGFRGYDFTYFQDRERDYDLSMMNPPPQDMDSVDGNAGSPNHASTVATSSVISPTIVTSTITMSLRDNDGVTRDGRVPEMDHEAIEKIERLEEALNFVSQKEVEITPMEEFKCMPPEDFDLVARDELEFVPQGLLEHVPQEERNDPKPGAFTSPISRSSQCYTDENHSAPPPLTSPNPPSAPSNPPPPPPFVQPPPLRAACSLPSEPEPHSSNQPIVSRMVSAPPQAAGAISFAESIACAASVKHDKLGDQIPKSLTSKVLTDEEVRLDRIRILDQVKKCLESMNQCLDEAQASGDKTSVYLSSKLRNKFLFLRNVYFSLPAQPMKQREQLRRDIALLYCDDENFLATTRSSIEHCYVHGYNDDGVLISEFTRSIVNPLTILYNFSDCSDPFTVTMCRTPGLMSLLVRIAEEQWSKIVNKTVDKYNRQVVRACVAVTYNCATRETNRKLLRQVGSVKMLIHYLDVPDDKFQLNALVGLAFLCDEHESEIFQAKTDVVRYFVKLLKDALADETKKSGGLSLYELTRGVCRLAINDVNKSVLGEVGALDTLFEIAALDDDDQEQVDALEAIWTLSFDESNKRRIRENERGMQLLQSLSIGAKIEKMGKTARGCLWTLRERRQSLSRSVPVRAEGDGQIMISYQWKYQPLMLQVRDRLRQNGYKIWIDVEQMAGSTLEAMAKAVEQSRVVLVAMSQSYKDSSNTRAEAEYAFTTRRTIIPLRVEPNYRPDGWLGLIIGSKLYFDISENNVFDEKMDELVKELSSQTNDAVCEQTTRPEVTSTTETNPALDRHPSRPLQRKPTKWDEDDMSRRLNDTVFHNSKMGDLTSEHCRFLWNMKTQTPKVYYDYMERYLSNQISFHDLDDLAKFSNHLDDVS